MYERWSQIVTWACRIVFAGAFLLAPWLFHLSAWLVIATLCAILILSVFRKTLTKREFATPRRLAWWTGIFMLLYWVALGAFAFAAIISLAIHHLGNGSALEYSFFSIELLPAFIDLTVIVVLGLAPIWEQIVYPLAGRATLQTIGSSEMTFHEISVATGYIQPFVVRKILRQYSEAGYLRCRTESCSRCRCENTYYRLTEEGRRFRLGLRAAATGLRQVV